MPVALSNDDITKAESDFVAQMVGLVKFQGVKNPALT